MKRYVLPTIKVLLVLAIAVALAKIAFFPSQEEPAGADVQPGYTVVTPTTTITTGDVSNTVDVSGQIVQDAAVPAPATLAGTVARIIYDNGDQVSAGDSILTLKKVEAQEPVTTTDEDGTITTTQPDPKVTWSEVYAPISGTIKYSVILDQEMTVGTAVATVTSGIYSATGTVSAAEQYRLTNAPAEGTITIKDGPAPFSCANLRIGTKATTSTTTNTEGDTTTTTGDGTSVEVRCTVPTDQTVFPGLKATIGIDAGSVTGALLAPVSAVEGSFTAGSVWVLSDPSDPKTAVKTAVTLGITDGTNIQITEGVKEGDTILQYVPGKDITRTGKPNTCEPDYSVCYDENGEEIR